MCSIHGRQSLEQPRTPVGPAPGYDAFKQADITALIDLFDENCLAALDFCGRPRRLPHVRFHLVNVAELPYLLVSRAWSRRDRRQGRDTTRRAHRLELQRKPRTVDVTGRDAQNTKTFRDVIRTGRAAIVIDGIAPGNGFNPWAIEIAGRAEAINKPDALIRIHPERVGSWGLEHLI